MQEFVLALAVSCGLGAASAALAGQVSLETGSVLSAAERLKAGEYIWAPQVAPTGPVLLVVSLATQRAILYRNGLPIAISTVSTGRPGYRTPTGIFTVLQRHVEHYSSLYNNAPMPYMQRLTWGGVALHGGNLPGFPASHGCIRLPQEFARLLYGATHLGMTVVVTDQAAVPRVAPAEALLRAALEGEAEPPATGTWAPERQRSGPVSIVISSADRRMVVMRNGTIIGRAPVTIDGQLTRTSVFMLQSVSPERRWLRVPLPGQSPESASDGELRGRIHVAEPFRTAVDAILVPGTTVVVTQDSLRRSSVGRPLTVIEGNGPPS